ncbi:MAG: ferrochelatase [Hyphomicrobiaceae bacterium]|nr:ferrochelatase [Hyphomicrobiaceae bacterium]
MTKPRRSKDFLPDARFAPEGHPQPVFGKVGILLLNLGTPDNTDYWSMRAYLKEFLSDRRVIEENPVLWWFILNGPILLKRPFSSGEAYRSIWNEELDESPLRTITRSQAKKLAEAFESDNRVVVDWGMRYGNPSTKSRIQALKDEGCDRILLFALYPQYAAATTATAYDKAFDALKAMRWQPAIRTVPAYYDDPVYIDALAKSLESELARLPWKPDVILASYHGLPVEYFEKGDPYHCHCQKTTRLLREKLKWNDDFLRTTFQSRFGKAEWLQPYTDKTVEALARDGVRNLAVVTPGFASDCVETLEEIAEENGDIFKENGGENFAAVPCLNDSEEGMAVIRSIVKRELMGWI